LIILLVDLQIISGSGDDFSMKNEGDKILVVDKIYVTGKRLKK